MKRVGIVGAGPAGLAAALQAAEAGHEVVVFEASQSVGGMAGSFELAGLPVDYGSHRLHGSTAPEFLQRLQSLLGADLQGRERNGRIRLQDRWVAFPLRLGDLGRRLPPGFGVRVGLEAITAPMRKSSDGGFVDEVSRRLGPTVATEFYRPYAEKLYGVDPATLTAELARRRVSASSPFEIAKKAFQARRPDGRTFYYPRRGYGQVSEALAQAASHAGAEIRLDAPVSSVTAGPTPSLVSPSGAEGFDVVLSTMPIPKLASALTPELDGSVAEAVRALRVRAMVLVYLVLDRRQYTPFDAHYFPSTDISISRLSEPKNYRDGDDPDDVTVLCAEVPCWPTGSPWLASDEVLAARVVDDLARAGLPKAEPVAVETRRLPAVYPVYERATDHHRGTVDRWVASIPGVLSFGRQGLGVPDNLHHVLDMGLTAGGFVERVDGGSVLAEGGRSDWNAQLARFASNVVVD